MCSLIHSLAPLACLLACSLASHADTWRRRRSLAFSCSCSWCSACCCCCANICVSSHRQENKSAAFDLPLTSGCLLLHTYTGTCVPMLIVGGGGTRARSGQHIVSLFLFCNKSTAQSSRPEKKAKMNCSKYGSHHQSGDHHGKGSALIVCMCVLMTDWLILVNVAT